MSDVNVVDKPLPAPDEIAKLPPDGGTEFNRLIHEKSPYLLQHARNPVDWYPWGTEAFTQAKEENKPIFLSVGYSTCHWCHVMERESFEKEDTAELLNKYYISIKVDREERPDIDEIYMNATQLIAGRGGWPNSVWLISDGRPWYAGTYFPPQDTTGRPGFRTILTKLAQFWQSRPEEVEAQANKLMEAMEKIASGQHVESTGRPTRELAGKALDQLRTSFDEDHGGFGAAPKFPPHGSFNLIFYEYDRSGDASLLEMATRTLDAMAWGGIRDHVGGGFHRYSTDAEWLLPHFEKMLYDNAQLSRAYVNAYLATQNIEYRDIACETYDWVLREMSHKDGAFYSALDADSEGVEGKFYLWTPDEIIEILGEREGKLFCRVYNIEPEGNFRDEAILDLNGTNIPHMKNSLKEIAESEGIPVEELRSRLSEARQNLLELRVKRIWPHLDDKVLTSWNGLMIGSLAYGGRHLNKKRYTAVAEKAADFILTSMRIDGRLLRTFREGEAKLNAYLDDYAFLADGLLDLYEATGNDRWLEETKALTQVLTHHYWDETGGGFFFTSNDHEELLTRSKDPFDKAIPSGNGIAARVLVRLGLLTGEQSYLDRAEATFDAFAGLMAQAPHGTENLILALAMYSDEPSSVGKPEKMDKQASSDTGIEADARIAERPVTAEVFVSRLKAAPGQTFPAALRLTIAEGWHINSSTPLQEYLKPLYIDLDDETNITIEDISYPEGREVTFPFNDDPLSVYDGEVWVKVELKVAGSAKHGTHQLGLEVCVQPCNDSSCLASKTLTLVVPIEISDDAACDEIRHDSIFGGL